jgi:hypothetical protein
MNTSPTIEPFEDQQNLATHIVKIRQDIDSIRGSINDSLLMGDSMFGSYGHIDITKQVKERNTELKNKKESLTKDIYKKEAIVQRSNREFSDVRDTLPEIQPKQKLHFIEDYSLMLLSISYLFMIIIFIYTYTATADIKLNAFFKSLLGSCLLTILSFILLYYLC